MKSTDAHSSGAANPEVAYEARDVSVGMVLRLGVILALTVALAGAVVWGTLVALERREARLAPVPSPLLQGVPRQLPPEPRLQGTPGHQIQPADELKQVQDAAEAILNSYGWVDEKSGIARIPIREAMKILATRGLPAAPASEVPAEKNRTAEKTATGRIAPQNKP